MANWRAHIRWASGMPLLVVAGLIIAGLYVWRLWLLPVHVYGHDEVQHLHIAWCISNGMVLYRDFFDHHTPWYNYLLSGVMHLYDVSTDIEDTLRFMTHARVWSWIVTGGTLALVFRIACDWMNRHVAMLAIALLAGTVMFLDRTIEIRPDILALFFWMACLCSLLRAVQCGATEIRLAMRLLFFSGVAIGGALMCTQKLLFAGPGMAAAMIWYLFDRRLAMPVKTRWMGFGLQVVGFILPLAATLMYYGARGAAYEFIECNFLMNAKWKITMPASLFGVLLLKQNPIQMAFAVSGIGWFGWHMFRRENARRGDYAIILPLLSLIAGLRIIPVPYKQYFLMMLPILSMLAAATMIGIVTHTTKAFRRDRYKVTCWSVFAGIILFSIVAVGIKPSIGQSMIRNWPTGVLLLWVLGAGLIVILIKLRTNPYKTLVLMLIMMTVHPIIQINGLFDNRNDEQKLVYRHVMEITEPTDIVFDGWPGRAWFRPHAWYYFFLHREMRYMIPEEEKQQLFEDLKSGKIAPTLVVLDKNVAALSPTVTAWFKVNYVHTGTDNVWRRPER